MKIRYKALLTLSAALLATVLLSSAAEVESGYSSLFDGKTLNGWKIAEENQDTWTIEDGALVSHGKRCHIFYVGDQQPFKNFDLKVDVMTEPGANGGIYFDTKYQPTGWPRGGFECQVNNTHPDWKRTGSLYDVVNLTQSSVQDNQWWTQEIIVQGNKVTVLLNGKRIFEYTEPNGVQPGKDFERKLGEGTFALQSHPGAIVRYKNIRVKRL